MTAQVPHDSGPPPAPAAPTPAHSPKAPSGLRGFLSNLAVPVLLVAAALGIGAALISSPPHVPKSDPEALAPVVGVAELVPHATPVYVEAYGTAVPARQIRVVPEVTGRIVELNPRVEAGGLIPAGDVLFKIDPADYAIAVAQAQADLKVEEQGVKQAEARIATLRSRGRQLDVEIAYLQWNAQRLGNLAEQRSAGESEARDARTELESQQAARETLNAEIDEQQRAAESARASVRVAERRLEAAQLALDRTQIKAPFDAMVLAESVEVGQRVGPQAAVATLVATDEFWVEAAVPLSRLEDVRFAVDEPDHPSNVRVQLATGGPGEAHAGVALRPLGNLDPLGRMARVLVSIRDPLGLTDNARAGRRILLGSYLHLRIEAGTLEDVYAIPRKALRENDRVWVRNTAGELAIHPVEIVWRRQDDVLVRNGFAPGDQLVTTHLASVVPGMPLRIRDAERPATPPATPSVGDSAVETAP
ncbi:MAG: HlyD family efflux transporter periplasmic adaptor subunit [Phycisphaerales bacterium]|nr:HlyD family efflux transporter periplasmic adaptor subunit [Phycisphaerales bacterium]